MICVYFLLLSRPGAMIASGEKSFPSEPLSPEAIVVYRESSNSNLSAHREAATSGFSIGFVSGSIVDSPAEEDGFELAVPPRRERLWAATPGKHCRFGPQPVSGSAFHAAVSDWQAQKSLSQVRYRWFESGSLQRRVRCEPISPGGGAERQAAFETGNPYRGRGTECEPSRVEPPRSERLRTPSLRACR